MGGSIGRWPLPLALLMPVVRGSGIALSVDRQALPVNGTNRLERGGFVMEVRLETEADHALLLVHVTSPTCALGSGGACAELATRQRIYGEESILGLPGSPWRAGDAAVADRPAQAVPR